MRVQSITVSCFRSFGEQQNMLQVNPGVTTIVGMNGSGIPSTGAENIKHLCSILLGWGFRFVALFDYDNEGKKCCKELEKELLLCYMSGFMMLKNIPAAEYDALQKIDADSAVVIESLLSEEDRSKYEIHRHGTAEQKKINAVKFADAISKNGQITRETEENFLNVLQAIEAYANREAEEGIPSC